jgi:hypothetical protein
MNVGYSPGLAALAVERARRDPLSVSDHNVAQLRVVDPQLAEVVRRRKALARDGRDATGAMVSLENAERIEFQRTGLGATASVVEGDAIATNALLMAVRKLADLVTGMNAKNVDRNVRIQTLETRCAELERRLASADTRLAVAEHRAGRP